MKSLGFIFATIFFTLNVFADQGAVWSCNGEKVTLSGQTNYFGENSKFSQTLYTLRNSDNEKSYEAAYFLTITTTPQGNQGNAEKLSGKNAVGGYFNVIITNIRDIGVGPVVNQFGDGIISYKHGHLQGKNEKVSCARQ